MEIAGDLGRRRILCLFPRYTSAFGMFEHAYPLTDGVRTPDEDLGNVAIIPGLVNAHTHLDLSGARGLIPPTTPDTFTDWLRGVIAYRRSRTPEQVEADSRGARYP